jgi:mannose-6-phosphate isomerase-like protein (cupin superfamily)
MSTDDATEDRADTPGLGTRYLINSADTDGRLALIEHSIPPHTLAAPVHTHENEDEYSWVLSGRMGVELDGRETEAGPGELVVKPRGIPHAFWNPGDEETRLLELISPGAFARYFADLVPVLGGDGPPDLARLAEIQASYGLTMEFESIDRLTSRHGLGLG